MKMDYVFLFITEKIVLDVKIHEHLKNHDTVKNKFAGCICHETSNTSDV